MKGGRRAVRRKPLPGRSPHLERSCWRRSFRQRQTWQVIGILSLLIALAGVGGVIHIGSQSKFIPYVVQVDKMGQTIAAGPVRPPTRPILASSMPRLLGLHQRCPHGDA
jgi:type IV secretory pathway TrbF-like protein